jgi:FMN phosphatase YigB (HAD superfamily)
LRSVKGNCAERIPERPVAISERSKIGQSRRKIIAKEFDHTFKPSPVVYAYLTRRVATDARSIWLISSNGWDVIGAQSAGLRAIWVQRNPDQILDPWGYEPDAIVNDLIDCANFFEDLDKHSG